ncbi:hypothetical protein C8J57DRAFT_1222316 [Mycena rebaudengoi]|nr:hypothetical protein C8J57DRAFT_1222316 [Mycena rebaudengoi]
MSNDFPDPTAPNYALLPPELARTLQRANYVTVGSAAVNDASVSAILFHSSRLGQIFIWDILHNLGDEYTILRKRKPNWTLLAYFASRFGAFGYVLGIVFFGSKVHLTIFCEIPLSNESFPRTAYPLGQGRCMTANIVVNSFYTVGISATCCLFFLRLRAVYANSPLMTAIFGVLWLAVVGAAVTVPIGAGAINIGPTDYCVVTEVAPISVASNIVVTVMVYAPGIDPVVHGLLAVPNAMLTSIMACRVYRHARLGLLRDTTTITPTDNSSVVFNTSGRRTARDESLVNFTRPIQHKSGEDTFNNKGAVLIAMESTTQSSYIGKEAQRESV